MSFALLLDLRDVYWARQGRISVDVGIGGIAVAGCYFAALPVLRRLRDERQQTAAVRDERQQTAAGLGRSRGARPAAGRGLPGACPGAWLQRGRADRAVDLALGPGGGGHGPQHVVADGQQ